MRFLQKVIAVLAAAAIITPVLFPGTCSAQNNIARINGGANDYEHWSKYKLYWEPSHNLERFQLLRQKSQNAILLTYLSALTVRENGANSYDYSYINNNHPEWFLTDSKGERIGSVIGGLAEKGRYFIDIGNPDFQSWAAEAILQKIKTEAGVYGNGMAIDNVLVKVPSLYNFKYTQDQWVNILQRYLGLIKTKLNANGYLLIGNLGADFKSKDLPGNIDKILGSLDGYLNEEFLSFWSIDKSYKNISEDAWLTEINNALWTSKQKGKIAIFNSFSYKLPDDDLKYLYGSFLLINNGKTYFAAASSDLYDGYRQGVYYNDRFGYGEEGAVWRELWDFELGIPAGDMYKANSVYQRDYSKAKIIVNPSDNSQSLFLGGNYYTTDGQSVKNITLAPKSAQILLTYACASHAVKKCYNNDLHWQRSCGIKEELVQDCGTDLCTNKGCVNRGGLLGDWRLDSETNKKFIDSSEYKNNGSYVNPSGASASMTSGKSGMAIKFNGSDYIQIPSNTGIDEIADGLTISYWIMRDKDGGGYHLLRKDVFGGLMDGGSNKFSFWTKHQGGDDSLAYMTDKLVLNEWHHVSLTWTAGIKSLYIDGSLVQSVSGRRNDDLFYVNGKNLTSAPLFIGNSMGWSTSKFSGAMDDVKIYARALSASEILALYNKSYGVCSAGDTRNCKVCSTDGSAWIDTDSKCSGNKKCFNGGCVDSVSAVPANVTTIALKSYINGKYVTAESRGTEPLIANRNRVSEWERFDLLPQSDGTVAIKSKINNKYVTAENRRNDPLIANRDKISAWEKFNIVDASLGYIALKSAINNKYVTAENRGNDPLIVGRDRISTWEKFAIIPLLTQACQNQCQTSGQKQCSGNEVQTCGDYNSDSCLEWSGAVSCASGKTCLGGQCVTSCIAKTCVTLGYSCGSQSDGCGKTLNCGTCASGKTCSDGKCVSNCALKSYKKCDGNNLYWYNSCNTKEELVQNCGVDASTSNYRCSGNWIQRESVKKGCSNNACTSQSEWSNLNDCAADGKVCANGVCASRGSVIITDTRNDTNSIAKDDTKPAPKMTRAEIIAKINGIKRLLVQLIMQLIIELQKQAAGAR